MVSAPRGKGESLLDRVARHERALVDQLEGARAEAQAVREQARHDAAGLLEQAEEDLARELAQRREEAKAAREREREDLLAQARRKAAADRTRPAWHDAVIDEIAALVIPQLPEAGDA